MLNFEIFKFLSKNHWVLLQKIKVKLEEITQNKAKNVTDLFGDFVHKNKEKSKISELLRRSKINPKDNMALAGGIFNKMLKFTNTKTYKAKVITIQACIRGAITRRKAVYRRKKKEMEMEESFLWRKFKILDFITNFG